METEILILAAGASSRMRGRDKLLEQIDGEALLTRITITALATGCPVSITLPQDKPARTAALAGLNVQIILVPNAQDGMATSLKTGLTHLPTTAPVLLLLADLPEITTSDLHTILTEWQKTPDLILRGCASDGTPGHPVAFPDWARAELTELTGDEGARSLLARHKTKVRLVALPGHHATTDLDTPEDWAHWRANRNC